MKNNVLPKISPENGSKWMLLSDIILIPLIFWIVLTIFHVEYFTSQFNGVSFFALFTLTLSVFWLTGRYNHRADILSVAYLSEHIIAGTLIFISLSVFFFFWVHLVQPTMTPLTGSQISVPVIIISSWWIRRLICMRFDEENDRLIIVLGDGKDADDLMNFLKKKSLNKKIRQIKISAQNCDLNSSKSIINEIKENIDHTEVIVIATDDGKLPDNIQDYLYIEDNHAFEILNIWDYYMTRWSCLPRFDTTTLCKCGHNLKKPGSLFSYEIFKRQIDIVISIVGLILTSPLLMLIFILVRAESRGPGLFKQTRVGLSGKEFIIYKFRTMQVGECEGSLYTEENDRRITKPGLLLRKIRLDELPQLYNVLRGDMSLIGPRPEWNKLVKIYEHKIPYYHYRHLIKPGITGWAQVNTGYGANIHDAKEKLSYDLFYINSYSAKLDLMVIIKTFYVALGFKGR